MRPKWAGKVWMTLLWVVLIGSGISWTARYDRTAGAAAAAPGDWPGASRLPLVDGQATLLMFLHPRCPCSRASLHELAALIEHRHIPVTTFIIEVSPPGAPQNWARTELKRLASTIPGAMTLIDNGGYEASTFDSKTSGDVFFYSAERRLLFQGGITPSRGHEGESPGAEALARILNGAMTTDSKAAVFGCPLLATRTVK